MQTTSTYKCTEKITRFTISTPLSAQSSSHDQHEVHIIMREGRAIKLPNTGTYRVHASGVLEVNLEATTTFYPMGEWMKIRDTNQTKLLKHFENAVQNPTIDNISLS